MKTKKQSLWSLSVLTLGLIALGCEAKTENPISIPQAQKDKAHANFVQCHDAALEVLLDVSGSDLEAQVLNNGTISVRDRTEPGSPYSSVLTNQPTYTIWGTLDDPAIRQFELAVADGEDLTLNTYDFKTGTATFIAKAGANARLLDCEFLTERPVPLSQ